MLGAASEAAARRRAGPWVAAAWPPLGALVRTGTAVMRNGRGRRLQIRRFTLQTGLWLGQHRRLILVAAGKLGRSRAFGAGIHPYPGLCTSGRLPGPVRNPWAGWLSAIVLESLLSPRASQIVPRRAWTNDGTASADILEPAQCMWRGGVDKHPPHHLDSSQRSREARNNGQANTHPISASWCEASPSTWYDRHICHTIRPPAYGCVALRCFGCGWVMQKRDAS
ncbi:hypothetical protein ACJZ2D_005105 [Fusarium nematophilum]